MTHPRGTAKRRCLCPFFLRTPPTRTPSSPTNLILSLSKEGEDQRWGPVRQRDPAENGDWLRSEAEVPVPVFLLAALAQTAE
jgi:hypothetical protein